MDQESEIAAAASVILNKEAEAAALLEAVTKLRKLLSIEQSPPIDLVLGSGVAPRLVELLDDKEPPNLQFEAGWALTNIASGTSKHARALIDLGVIPAFIRLLASPNEDVVEQVIWGLGNLAGDCPAVRDMVLNAGVLTALVPVCERITKLSFMRNSAWLVSNLNRGKPQPRLETVAPSLQLMARWVFSTDDEVVTDALWGLSYMCDGPNERIGTVIESGVTRRVVELLLSGNFSVVTPALRTVGNIVTGDDMHTQTALNCELLPALRPLLVAPKKGVRKEACWAISNITAGTREQIQAVLDAGLMEPLIEKCTTDDADVRKEACWAISNATSGGSSQQICQLVQLGCVQGLAPTLQSPDSRVVAVAIEALANIAQCAEAVESGAGALFAEAGVQEALEGLGDLEEREDYDKVQHILEIVDTDVMSILVKPAHQLGAMRITDDDEAEAEQGEGDSDDGDGREARQDVEKKKKKPAAKSEHESEGGFSF